MAFTDKATKLRCGSGFAVVPGVTACFALAVLSVIAEALETSTLGYPYVESLVVAIILGMIVRTIWRPSERWLVGIEFSARRVLEIAVVLFGAALSFASIAASGFLLIGTIVAVISVVLVVSYGLSRALGLSTKMSILIACGNSICGNSAIAAVAPVIGADSNDVGASISFTAILGVATVLGLPLLIPLLDLSASQYGILAGMTVYAVPQVLAATVPIGPVSAQIGTMVKLLRVLMLGPVVLALSVFMKVASKYEAPSDKQRSPFQWVPWFIPGFFFLATLRSFDLLPGAVLVAISTVASCLTIVSMAALGLGVNLRHIFQGGLKTIAAVTLSLAFLLLASLITISLLF